MTQKVALLTVLFFAVYCQFNKKIELWHELIGNPEQLFTHFPQ